MNRRIDAWMISVVMILIVLGLMMIYSASAMVAGEWSGDEARYVKRQSIAIAIGLVLCVASAVTPMRSFRRYQTLLYAACATALVACLLPGISVEVKGASRWIGYGSFHLQPSEFAKIIVLISMGDYIHRWRGHIHDPRVLLQSLWYPIPIMALIFLQPDFGTTAIVGGLAALMLITAGMRLRHIAAAFGMVLILGIPMMIAEPYRVRRITSFLNPWENADGDAYNVIQSWLAMHSGGLWGQGLGNSVAKLHYLPEPWTDFIGAVLAEELGFVAIVGLISLFGILVWRGLHIARHARDPFSMYLATCLTAMFGFEAFFNLGVVMGMIPPKGLVLPFISYGSSAMISNLWAIGILLSIAAESDELPVHEGWAHSKKSRARAPTPATASQG